MPRVSKHLRRRSAGSIACAIAALWGGPANADSDLRLFTPDTLEIGGDIRLVAINGEKSWVNGGFGKLRSGDHFNWEFQPQLGNASLTWKPQITWSLGATIVGSLQGGQLTRAGISEAFLSFRPMRGSKVNFAARAGLMWPPISLEHEGADWHVADSITPSAINSWIGEEVRPAAVEGTVGTVFGSHKLKATAAVFVANDTSGTLLTFRGWAIHDRTTLAFNRQPLPPLEAPVSGYQAPYTHPLLDVGPGFAHRPGFYAKLSWQPPIPARLELFHYDNRADPEAVDSNFEWGWRTQFDNAGLLIEPGDGTQLKFQALAGRTKMGFAQQGRRWVDNRFRAAYGLASHQFGLITVTLRGDVFGTHNRGSDIGDEYDDSGWSAMIAAKRSWQNFTGLIELLHVSSRREDRQDIGVSPRQDQSQVQAEMRMHW
jgi:hypothetical protein